MRPAKEPFIFPISFFFHFSFFSAAINSSNTGKHQVIWHIAAKVKGHITFSMAQTTELPIEGCFLPAYKL